MDHFVKEAKRELCLYSFISELVCLFTLINLQPSPYVCCMTLNEGQSILKTLSHLAIVSCVS